MTNNGIKTSRILDVIYKEYAEDWREQRKTDSRTGEYVRLMFSGFSKALRKNELIMDPRTIKLKWDLLTDIGIFAASNKISAVVDLVAFEDYKPGAYSFFEGAHIHTQKPATAQEASQ